MQFFVSIIIGPYLFAD